MQDSIPGELGVKAKHLCYPITYQAMLICYDCLYLRNHESISTNCKLNSFRRSLNHYLALKVLLHSGGNMKIMTSRCLAISLGWYLTPLPSR